ncbi:MAG: 30S ribosomal protein S12 methylthiotransferase RimO [Rectinema sp.]|nr:30S ribosomal protein S12 methylthiotransferase RimO [Rectinema sp.]
MASFYIDQHGCAKNQVDGEEISTRLIDNGFLQAESPDGADIIIINTCGFIEDAKRESIDAIIAARRAWPEKKVVIAGCLSQRYSKELFAEMSEADGVLGNADLSTVPAALRDILTGTRMVLSPPPPSRMPEHVYIRKTIFDFPGTAHIKIAEGCSNHCAYCAIPLIRGELRSRNIDDIVEECRVLIDRGMFELVLIGQDLGNYGRDLGGRCLLPDLFEALERIPGEFRVRPLYIHPDHFPMEILPFFGKNTRFVPYFDIPFQHASGTLLARMNRHGSAETYLDLLAAIRDKIPDAMIRSTFMVGFPGETEEDFRILLEFQEQAQLDWLGTFIFSREEHTPAWNMKPVIPKTIAKQRKALIEEAQTRITAARLNRFIGQSDFFIIEERFEHDDLCIGRGWMQAPDVDGVTLVHGAYNPGERVRARIVSVNGVDFNAIPEYTAEP